MSRRGRCVITRNASWARAATLLAAVACIACAAGCRPRPRPPQVDITRQLEAAALLQQALQPDPSPPANGGSSAPMTEPATGPATDPAIGRPRVLRLRGDGFRIECPADRSAWLVTDDGTRLRLVSGERQRAWEGLLRMSARGTSDGASIEHLADRLLVETAAAYLPTTLAAELRRPDGAHVPPDGAHVPPGGDALPRLARRLLDEGAVHLRDADGTGDLDVTVQLTPRDREALGEALASREAG